MASVLDLLADGFMIKDHEFSGSTNGDRSHAEHCIRAEAANTPARRAKPLGHEIVHVLLHEQFDSRPAELDAESAAHIVCQSLGLDTSGYSFGNVAIWPTMATRLSPGIKHAASIQRAAATSLRSFEPAPVEQAA